MKITLEPGGQFPPSPLVAANIRAALEAAMVAVDTDAPTLQPGDSLTAWFNPTTGDVTFYVGVNPVAFKFRHSIVSETAPTNPVPGMQWFNTNDGAIYTWYASEWVAGDAELPFGVNDLLALLRASTVSDTPPENPTEGQQWFRTVDGYIYTWYDGGWVAGEAAFVPELEAISTELAGKADKRVTIIPVSAADTEVLPEHSDAYVRFTNANAKTYTIPVDVDFEDGAATTLRNIGAGTLTILADVGVTLNFAVGANVLTSQATAQLLKVGTNTWDLI